MTQPVLWHIPVSHYNEKARWALDHKGVDHARHAPPPPSHMPVALWLTRGRGWTFPLLQIDGRTIADSTAIIAALEQRWRDRPLYPSDPAERDRALALEDFFDEELGPYSRLLAFHEFRKDPAVVADFAGTLLSPPLGRSAAVRRAAGAGASAFIEARYRVSADAAAEHAGGKVLAALDRLEAELATGDGEHLVGDRFTVADLTAAALLGPIVMPPEGPELPPAPAPFLAFREPLRERPGFRWVERVFARHRAHARRP